MTHLGEPHGRETGIRSLWPEDASVKPPASPHGGPPVQNVTPGSNRSAPPPTSGRANQRRNTPHQPAASGEFAASA